MEMDVTEMIDMTGVTGITGAEGITITGMEEVMIEDKPCVPRRLVKSPGMN
jgi:hypothetical protein